MEFKDIFKSQKAKTLHPDETFLEPNFVYQVSFPDLLVEVANKIDVLKAFVVREETLKQKTRYTLIIDTKQIKCFDIDDTEGIISFRFRDKKIFVKFNDYCRYLTYFLSLEKKSFNIADLYDNFILLGKSNSYYWFLYFPVNEPYKIARFEYDDREENLLEMFERTVRALQRMRCVELHIPPETDPIEISPEKVIKPIENSNERSGAI